MVGVTADGGRHVDARRRARLAAVRVAQHIAERLIELQQAGLGGSDAVLGIEQPEVQRLSPGPRQRERVLVPALPRARRRVLGARDRVPDGQPAGRRDAGEDVYDLQLARPCQQAPAVEHGVVPVWRQQ